MRIDLLGIAVLATLLSALGTPSWAVTTGTSGGGQVMFNEQPSLPISYVVRTSGLEDDLGEVGMFAGNYATQGWALANGQILSINQYPELFDKIGTAFGGDGTSTFALPDLRGRTPIGVGAGPGLAPYSVGQVVGGLETASAALPLHTHGVGSAYTTSDAGASTHLNLQPSLALTPIIATTGTFPSRNIIAGDSPPEDTWGTTDPPNFGVGDTPFLAEMTWIAHNDIPTGWRYANGDLLDIVDHQALYSILGTRFGGDGEVNFALPDLRSRTAVGTGFGAGLTGRSLGEQFGEETETLTVAHVPPHSHPLPGGGATETVGGGETQSNLQPSLGITHIVALEGVYPSQNSPSGGGGPNLGTGNNPFIGSISMFAGDFAPRDFALAQGQLINIAFNPALFSIVGTTYGGDGEVTFGIPDLQGRLPVDAGQGPGLPNRHIGVKFGLENSTIPLTQIEAHVHQFVALPGDWDFDGDVDGFNFLQWQRGESPDPLSPGDFFAWEAGYGQAPPASIAVHRVPEPRSLVLVAMIGILISMNHRDWGMYIHEYEDEVGFGPRLGIKQIPQEGTHQDWKLLVAKLPQRFTLG